ncbi:peptidoglycan-binding protein [Marinococcus halophilus]|uniref:peptidoglycan-binding protein n=1 Tax=Marinococcus halophilus TaxID=1371 RepID=UPI0015C49496|nr:peptidoglycan-binding protein [Marinococcus halophilus]
MFSSKKIIFFSSFIVSVSLGSFATADTAQAKEENNHNELYMTQGTEASEVKELEEALIVLGYPLQEADTLFDSDTSIHISDYQERNSFEVTGEVDQELLDNILDDVKSKEESEASTNTDSEEDVPDDSSTDQPSPEDTSEEENSELKDDIDEASAENSSGEEKAQELEEEPAVEHSEEDSQQTEIKNQAGPDNAEEETVQKKQASEATVQENTSASEDEPSDNGSEDTEKQEEVEPQKERTFVLAARTFSSATIMKETSSTILKDGVTSPAAKAMKENLYTLGYLDIADPNERFGPQTEAAVKAFQRDHGLVVDGVAGPNTLAKLNEVLKKNNSSNEKDEKPVSTDTILKDGVASPAAKAMKQNLYTLGYLDIADPNERFGPQTEAAVKAFQRDHGLVVDGVAGPNTLAKLNEVLKKNNSSNEKNEKPISTDTVLKDGVTSSAAKAMKADLYTLGYLDIADPNERFGPQTEAAVKAFQRDHGLVVDGVAGPNTLAKLNEVLKNSTKDEDTEDEALDSDSTLLKDGVRSKAAKAMKADLYTLGYLDISEPTTHFGPITEAAVKDFQRDHGLVVDGIAGPKTLAKISEVLNNPPTDKDTEDEELDSDSTLLKDGVRSEAAKAMKADLYTLGYLDIAEPTTHFGPITEAAVKDFQRDHGLVADGIAGPKTLAKISEVLNNSPKDEDTEDEELDSDSTLLKDGVRSEAAKAMKADLYTLGYLDIAEPTTHFGPITEAAVKDFQRDHGLVVDGIAGPKTLAKISEVLNNPPTDKDTEDESAVEMPAPFTEEIKQGDEGEAVLLVKQYLKAAGFNAGSGSVFDNSAVEQLKAFQQARSLTVTGVADAPTLRALLEERETTYVFTGKDRFGHGVGMTQWGAYGMAQNGQSYKEILNHYYTGINVGTSEQYKSQNIRVLFEEQINNAVFSSSSTYSIKDTNGTTLMSSLTGETTVKYANTAEGGQYTITNNGKSVTSSAEVIASGNGTFSYQGNLYKGELHFPKSNVKVNGNTYRSEWVMDVVNHVNIDTYLEGVVPYEMIVGWQEPEAFKAQAVASRSYALTKLSSVRNFDVYDDTRSQVYHGVPTGSRNDAMVLNAIQTTSGQTINYGGRLAEAIYSASASGHTVDAGDVWGNSAPYLIGVPDPYDASRYAQNTWTYSISNQELSDLSSFKAYNKGKVLDVDFETKNERLQTVIVHFEQGDEEMSADQFRSKVGSNVMTSNIMSINTIN